MKGLEKYRHIFYFFKQYLLYHVGLGDMTV